MNRCIETDDYGDPRTSSDSCEPVRERHPDPTAGRARNLAEGIAHFLYWSSYLDFDPDAISGIFISPVAYDTDDVSCGTDTFKRLKESLDRHFPDWRSWNSNYQKPPKHTLHDSP